MQTCHFTVNLHSIRLEASSKSAEPEVGPYLWAGCCEWKSEIKARSRAPRAFIAQFYRLPIRAARPEVGPYLGLSACMLNIHQQLFQQFSITPVEWREINRKEHKDT
jgi:hypothetical protein